MAWCDVKMNSIRVSGLREQRSIEELKVYFSKPRNGGGKIHKIYYPLLHNDAVIVYEEESGKLWYPYALDGTI